jgi:radical SAM/Cys-rich protein
MILKTLHREGNSLASPTQQRVVLGDSNRIPSGHFQRTLDGRGIHPIVRRSLETVQINVGKVCNQTCSHCHVDAGPDRRESMNSETAQQVIEFLKHSQAVTLDITGGAPEMNPNFCSLVEQARGLDKRVVDRCNLTILLAPGFTYLPEFLAKNRVTVVASLPCYVEENCDAQRGGGVFSKSIQAIRKLNELGYGQNNSNLELDLVYNPVGTGLPPDQIKLEQDYRDHLDQQYGIQFNRLYTITNMPISRFLNDLLRQGKYEAYMQKLIDSFNPLTLYGLMCRSLVSVDWEGYLYDCDFNQMLDMPICRRNARMHISGLSDSDLAGHLVETFNHCYGCTSGGGSSCTGSLV